MTFMMQQGSNGSFINQENKPPEELAAAKMTAAYTPVASPVSRGLGLTPRAFPVKNTFIHYGTPVSHAQRALASPKTVPPNFAPEQHEEEARAAAIPEERLPPFTLSYLTQSCGRPPTAPGPAAAVGQPLQGPRGQGIAPLKLFDYLPSPKAQQMAPLVPQMAPLVPQMPGTQAPPGVAQPQVLLGAGGCGGNPNCGTCNFCSCCGAMPWPMQHQMPPLPMPQMPPLPPPMPPMAPSQQGPFVPMPNFGCHQESFASAMGWTPWAAGSDYGYGPPVGAPRPPDAAAPGAVCQVMQNAPMMPQQQVQSPPLPTLRIDLQLQQP